MSLGKGLEKDTVSEDRGTSEILYVTALARAARGLFENVLT